MLNQNNQNQNNTDNPNNPFWNKYGGGITNIIGGLSNLFGGHAAGQDIQQGLNQILSMFNQGKQGLQPFLSGGQGAFQNLQSFLNNFKDPTKTYNDITKNWSMSPAAQLQLQQGIQAANQGAAASGMLGSTEEQKQLQNYGQQVTNADQQQYFNNIMGLNDFYSNGLNNMSQYGFNAGNSILNNSSSMANAIAQMYASKGQAAGTQAGGGGSILGGLSKVISWL